MLIFDRCSIGNRLLAIRRRRGLTQAETAELAGLSDRTYADIERGTVNMRLETLLRICDALHISPDEILTQQRPPQILQQEALLQRLEQCSAKEKETAMAILSAYLQSLEK